MPAIPSAASSPGKGARAEAGSPVVYNNLGVAYIMLGRHDEAIAACRKALELNPSFSARQEQSQLGPEREGKGAGPQ